MNDFRRVTIVTGHYGSGKSEFSINLALLRVAGTTATGTAGNTTSGNTTAGRRPGALADVDVVNPYFRSREQRALLESRGIRVVGNQLGIDQGVDLPALSPEVFGLIRDRTTWTILDAGGDPVGARLLGSMRRLLDPFETEVLCVINGSRRETCDPAGAIMMIRNIEAAAGLTVTGLVNNTHMLEHTVVGHLEEGERLCKAVLDDTGIPVRYVGVPHWLLPGGNGAGTTNGAGATNGEARLAHLSGQVVPIGMFLRESWMKTPVAPGATQEEQ